MKFESRSGDVAELAYAPDSKSGPERVEGSSPSVPICSSCLRELPLEAFAFRSRKLNKRHSKCKDCKKVYNQSHYQKDKESYSKRARKNTARYKAAAAEYILEHLQEHPCVDCGEPDPVVLEFDHLRDKKKNLSRMVSNGCSIQNLQKEIDKCEVRCANCHRRKTAKNRGFYRYSNGSKWKNVKSAKAGVIAMGSKAL